MTAPVSGLLAASEFPLKLEMAEDNESQIDLLLFDFGVSDVVVGGTEDSPDIDFAAQLVDDSGAGSLVFSEEAATVGAPRFAEASELEDPGVH